MKLRTRILIFLFLFAFTPLFAAFVINLPLVLDRFERFYQEAHLQNLRADFRDLDQHLASRHELVGLLAKLPEPGILSDSGYNSPPFSTGDTQYLIWLNHILRDQLDVVQIVFLDQGKKIRQTLLRNNKTHVLQPIDKPLLPITEAFATIQQGSTGSGVLISPIHIYPALKSRDARFYLTLDMVAPVYHPYAPDRLTGWVMITIDLTNFARQHHDILWVEHNGQYLFKNDTRSASAFDDFPDLQHHFTRKNLALTTALNGDDVMWVPLLATSDQQPLWVGRRVDTSPLQALHWAVSWRVIVIMLLLSAVVYYLARKFARRIERFDRRLTDSISQILEESREITLDWQGPQEIRELGVKLSQLSHIHAQNSARLIQHTRELEASNRYKSQFLANVSHELRTPLNSILLLSRILYEDPTRDKALREKCRIINTAGKDLKALIDNILDLSRIEAGKSTLNLHQVNLRELLDDTILLVQPQFEDKGLQLTLTISDTLPGTVYSDADKIRQILKNFLSNAVKFTEQGEVNIHVNATKTHLSISVTDHGIGISQDKQGIIFKSFQQADGSISRKHGGTGLGLAISAQLAELLGGSITVQSQPGQGATFTLTLPQHLDTDHIDPELIQYTQEIPAQTEALQPANLSSGQHQPDSMPDEHPRNITHLLVIDNDIKSLLNITPILEADGYQVSAAADGEEVMDTLQSDPDIHLIILGTIDNNAQRKEYATIESMLAESPFSHLPRIILEKSVNQKKLLVMIKNRLKGEA